MKNARKETVEKNQIQEQKKSISTKAIRALLYSIALIITFSAINISTFATETGEKAGAKSEVKGKYIGLYYSDIELGRKAVLYYDSETSTINFKPLEYYRNHKDEMPASIKVVPNIQEKVKIHDVMYRLFWGNGELIKIVAIENIFQGQDNDINQHLSKYPVFSNADRPDYDAEPMKKYEYINIDDENLKDDEFSYTVENLGLQHTNYYFALNIKDFEIEPNTTTATATRIKNIKLPEIFTHQDIFEQEVGKTHYTYTFFKNQEGGYDLLVIYFRLEKNGTMTVVRDYHGVFPKGRRYTDIFAMFKLEKKEPKKMKEHKEEQNKSQKKAPSIRKKEDAAVVKVEKANAEKGNIYIKAGVLVIIISAITATIILLTKSKNKNGEDEK